MTYILFYDIYIYIYYIHDIPDFPTGWHSWDSWHRTPECFPDSIRWPVHLLLKENCFKARAAGRPGGRNWIFPFNHILEYVLVGYTDNIPPCLIMYNRLRKLPWELNFSNRPQFFGVRGPFLGRGHSKKVDFHHIFHSPARELLACHRCRTKAISIKNEQIGRQPDTNSTLAQH